MLRWNAGFLTAAVIAYTAWGAPLCSSCIAQSNNQSGSEGYYSRPDLRRALPERLVPPGRMASPVPPVPINRVAAGARQDVISQQQPAQSDARQVAQGTAGFSLPPIVQASEIDRGIYYAPAPTPDSSRLTANLGSQFERQNGDSGQIPAHYPRQDNQVTRARFLTVQQGGDPFGQAPRRDGRANNSGPRPDDPFADPPVDDVSPQDRENPFADPPQNQVPQNRQNPFADPPPDKFPQNQDNPFDDPPPDMDPNQTQNPFGPPDGQPDEMPEVDPFANSPQNIDPAQSFPGSDEPELPDDPEILVDPGPGPDDVDAKPPRAILGPFKSRGFEPKPLLPAPPSREYPQYPGPANSIGIDPNDPYALGGDPYLNQPTLNDPATYGFQKSHLYEGIPQSYQEQDFAAYRCADCGFDSRLPGSRFIDRFRCRTCDGCRPTAFNNCAPQFVGENQCYPLDDYSSGYIDDGSYQGDWDVGCSDCCFDDPQVCCGGPMFYRSLFGGYTQLEDSSIDNASSSAATNRLQFNDGYGIGAALGQIQGENLRTEIEFGFRDLQPNQVTDFSVIGVPGLFQQDLGGSVKSYTGMVNFAWDFQPRPMFCWLRPYAGAGVGFAFVDTELAGGTLQYSASDTAFAWQLFGGLSRRLTDQVDGFAEYRYFKASDIRADQNGSVFDYETDNIFFGVRMHF